MWGYDDFSPGKTIMASTNRPVHLRFINRLPYKHLFDVDLKLHGTNRGEPHCRVSIHLHGGRVPWYVDGRVVH